jgi:hypothetical protein
MNIRRRAVLVVGVLCVLAVALFLGGGIYRTINPGYGHVYLVNRFTGRAFLLSGAERLPVKSPPRPRPKRKETAGEKAIRLDREERAKAMRLAQQDCTWSADGLQNNNDWARERARALPIEDQVLGWGTQRSEEFRGLEKVPWKGRGRRGEWMVSYTCRNRKTGEVRGWWLLVDAKTGIVRSVHAPP